MVRTIPLKALSPKYLPSLTGFRALAAFMVFFHHINPLKDTKAPSLLVKMIDEMHIGVSLFFVLSGFIISYQYLLTRQVSYGSYLWKRFTRIFPLFGILTLLTYGVSFWYFNEISVDQLWELFFNMTLLKGFFGNYIFTGIAQAWTLTVEECFYLTAPVLAAFLFKNSTFHLLLLTFLILLTGIALMVLSQLLPIDGFMPDFKFLFHFTFFGRSFEFLMGMFIAQLFVKSKAIKRRYFTLVGTAGVLLTLLFLALLSEDGAAGDSQWTGIVINNFLLPIIGIGPLIWGLLHEKTYLKTFLATPFMQLLGNASYAFYLIHIGLFKDYIAIYISNFWLLLIVLQVIAILLFLYIETPIKIFLRKIH
ncbi:acyltransferase [Echinicola sp. CAU 1574]|uniref:Acyltransferase n=1 Tax=Echinicola arenosa TaxID=2774144 RepID=A0ABR9AF48_9BACT|nr:acyltransferase [Echinicola arenosa]MBD8487291.1 acyltransferase [Echinicola arenosa]